MDNHYRNRLENKRMQQLLGLNTHSKRPLSRSSSYYFQSASNTVVSQRSAETQTNITDFAAISQLLNSPPIIKKVKVNRESTRDAEDDDLYCYEQLDSNNSPIVVKRFALKCVVFPKLPEQKAAYSINANYISAYKTNEFNFKTRAIVLSRIIDNCKDLQLKCSYAAIALFDRFLDKLNKKQITNQQQLRFLSLAVIFVASKMNENAPANAQLLKQTSLNMTQAELIQYERLILKTLDWNVNPITIHDYLEETILRFQCYFSDQPIFKSSYTDPYEIRLIQADIINLTTILNVMVLDHNYLAYECKELAFSLLYTYYRDIVNDDDYQEFCNQYELTMKQLLPTIKFVSKFVRVVQSLVDKDVQLNQLEILKLIVD